MKRKLRYFRQHTLETCGISCILMILDYFHRIQYPTEKQERKLYSLYRCRSFCGVHAASAAECLSKNRLSVALYHSSPRGLENRDNYFPEALFCAIFDEYQAALDRAGDRIHVEYGVDLTPKWLQTQMASGKLAMLQCIVPGDADGLHDHVLHWILCYGCRDKEFMICDPIPQSGKLVLSEAELTHYMDTPIGKCAVVVSGD